jgi:hypothetical protein
MNQEILPPLPAHAEPADAFDFTPVPRATKRWNGITDQKQHAFIANLAGSGCVKMAADSIGTSTSAMYQLRKRPGAESFAAAWDKAVEAGARRVLDLLMAHAIHGTPETLLKDGEVILERRKYNTRAMMWIVQQRFPEQYGGNLNVSGSAANSMPHSVRRLQAQWRKEWEEEHRANAQKRGDEGEAIYTKRVNAIRKGFKREIAPDPLKRAAWEILCGPTDWEDCDATPDYDGLPKECHTNHNRPDMIVLAAALDVDTPDWGLLKAMEQGAFGPERQAEALEAKRLREGG